MARSDRPWHRSLVKSGVLFLLGPARAHAQDWFPGLRLSADMPGMPRSILYQGETVGTLSSADDLRNRAGGAIYIVGSGPSVTNCDLRRLPAESAILLNGAITLIGSKIDQPLAVAIEDERFIWRSFDLVRSKVAPGTVCLFSVAVMRAICEHDRQWLKDKTVVLIDDLRKPYRGSRRAADAIASLDFVVINDDSSAGLSLSPDRGVVQGGSVAVSAMQFALYCNPQTIGLFGIDISNAREPRFYEAGKPVAFSGVAGAEARILAHLSLARRIATDRQIEILNFSPVSALLKQGFGYDDRFALPPESRT